MKDEAKAEGPRSGGAPASGDARLTDEDPQRRSAPSGRKLDDFTRARLGTHLRAMYDQMVQQPVPDRFHDLIARLDAGEVRAAPAAADEDPGGEDA